jgi:hypothetical protein
MDGSPGTTRANRADLPRRGRSAWRQGTGGRAAIRRPSASDDGRADPGDAPEYWRGAASNTSDCSPHASVAAPRSMPIRRTGPGCCARVASGQAAAAPPTSVMNSRRCPVPLVLPTERITHLNYGRRLLRCGISLRPMTASGHSTFARSQHVRLAPLHLRLELDASTFVVSLTLTTGGDQDKRSVLCFVWRFVPRYP